MNASVGPLVSSQEIPRVPPAAPYRGIEPFRLADTEIFFARDRDRRRLLRYVTVYRGVLLYGDSGVGKSSLVNAGLLSDTIAQGLTPERLRVQSLPGGEFVVERISLSSDDQPPYLPSIIVDEGNTESRPLVSASALLEKLRNVPPGRQSLLIFDQFEEFNTLFEEAPSRDELLGAREAQERVLNTLTELLNDFAIPVKLVFTFREEYLPKLEKLFRRHPGLTDQAVRLIAPEAKELGNMIGGPLRKFPVPFGGRFPDWLVEHLTADFGARFLDRPVNPSEVQIACWQLWRASDPGAVYEMEELTGLIEAFFVEQFEKIPVEDRSLATAILARMVTQSGARNYVSGEDLTSLVRIEEPADADHVGRVLALLDNETRLVQRELRQNVSYYTIVSEFLVPWIGQQNANRLREVERRKAEHLRAEERAEAQRKLEKLELERTRLAKKLATRRARTARRALAIAAVVILCLVYLIAKLSRQRVKLQRQARAIQATADSLDVKAHQLQNSRDSLSTAMTRLENANSALRSFIAQDSVAAAQALVGSNTPREALVPIVYIQFHGGISQQVVDEFRAELNRAGYVAPGTELMRNPFSSRVSYFRSNELIFADAVRERVERFFERKGCPIELPLSFVPEYAPNADPRQVEVWINHSCPPSPTVTSPEDSG